MYAALYASYLFGNLVEQLWNFAWPAALAILHPSLLPVAIVGFFGKVPIAVLNSRDVSRINNLNYFMISSSQYFSGLQ